MSKKPPNRPGITFEIGARLEALDYLQKWYGRRCVVFAESIIILGSLIIKNQWACQLATSTRELYEFPPKSVKTVSFLGKYSLFRNQAKPSHGFVFICSWWLVQL